MKYLLLSCTLLCAGVSFSQSKKKQIQELQRQNDSLRIVNEFLSAENSKQAKTIEHQEASKASDLETLRKLDQQRAELRIEIASLKNINYKLQQNAEGLEPKIEQPKPRNPHPFTDKGMGGVGGPPLEFGDGIASSDIPWNNRRRLLNNVDLEDVEIDAGTYISYRLTIDQEGRVVDYKAEKNRSTTSDQKLIDSVGMEIKKQVTYEKAERPQLVYKRLAVSIETN